MDLICKTDFAIAHTTCLARSLKHWTGRELLPDVFNPIELSQKIFEAPFALVSHGMEADPVLNYGNRAALALWEMSWGEFDAHAVAAHRRNPKPRRTRATAGSCHATRIY